MVIISGYFQSLQFNRPLFLKLSLVKIYIPANIIFIIFFLTSNHKSKVNTEYGLTPSFQMDRGIDQGDSISPLL